MYKLHTIVACLLLTGAATVCNACMTDFTLYNISPTTLRIVETKGSDSTKWNHTDLATGQQLTTSGCGGECGEYGVRG